MPEWIRHFLDAARVDSTKSSALAPLQWLIAICFAGSIGLGYATGTAWVSAVSLAFPAGLSVFYCVAYRHHMLHNPDALRSERYSLHKMAMEKGLIGDDRAGLMLPEDAGAPEKVPEQPRIPHAPEGPAETGGVP